MNKDIFYGGLYGHLIGDALGVPYEFKVAREIPELSKIEMIPPDGCTKTYPVPEGSWSDDGALMLCLIESILDHGYFNIQGFCDNMVKWYSGGHNAVDGRLFDIGISTASSLLSLQKGMHTPFTSGGTTEGSNGNGSLMRVLPISILFHDDKEKLIANSIQQSIPTHNHPRSLACCVLYSLYASAIIEDRNIDEWDTALNNFEKLVRRDDLKFELDNILSFTELSGDGYVVDSLMCAKHLLDNYDNYEDIVRNAIAFGNDTDTTACIVGGLAGLKYGYEQIPVRWLDTLRGEDILERIVKQWEIYNERKRS